jgi:hypothetical protein
VALIGTFFVNPEWTHKKSPMAHISIIIIHDRRFKSKPTIKASLNYEQQTIVIYETQIPFEPNNIYGVLITATCCFFILFNLYIILLNKDTKLSFTINQIVVL